MTTFKEIMSRAWWVYIHRFVALVSLVAAVLIYNQQQEYLNRQQDYVNCMSGYLDAQSRSNLARSQAIEDSLTAVDDSIHGVATSTTREQVRRVLANYEATREAARVKRASNPPPAPPSVRCG